MSDPERISKNQAIYRRLRKAFEERFGPIKDIDIARKIGPSVSKTTISDWKKGKGSPTKHLDRISELTKQPIDYFLKEDAENESNFSKEAEYLTAEEKACALLGSLPPAAKTHALAMLEGLAHQQGMNIIYVDRQKKSMVSEKTRLAARKDRERGSPGK